MPNDAENAGRELRTRVARYIARHLLLNGEGPLFIGFSGGADSSALLLLLHEIAPDAIAIHLHHGLRDDAADRDAAWCAEFCGARRIAFECHALRVPANRRAGESAETAARRCRLEFWQQRAGSAATVALGHQADDNLETLLQRLLRGANASGLAALRPSRVVAGVRFVRPLLCAQRPELVAFLETEGVHDWREDLTNLDTRLNRNAIRHRCLPLLRQITGHDLGLRQSLAALCDDADFIEGAARNVLPQADHAASLRQLHPALLPRVVRLWLRQRLGRDMVPSRAAIERLQAALDA